MASGQMTLLQLRTLAKQEADMVGSAFLSDAEWNSYLNQSYFELYDLLVQKYGDDYFVGAPYSITTDGVNSQFALPSDFYKLLGVDLSVNGNQWQTLHRFNMAERNRDTALTSPYGARYPRYRLSGSNIWFSPLPSGGLTLQLWYVPRMSMLASDSDTADGVSGWLEYVVVDAAIKAKDKEESDVSVLLARKAGLIQRIEAASENRDAGQPMTVSDNSRMGLGYGYGQDDGWHF